MPEQVKARAYRVPKKRYTTGQAYLKDLQGREAIRHRITVDDLTVEVTREKLALYGGLIVVIALSALWLVGCATTPKTPAKQRALQADADISRYSKTWR